MDCIDQLTISFKFTVTIDDYFAFSNQTSAFPKVGINGGEIVRYPARELIKWDSVPIN